jgi:hypothetical protein
VFFLKFCGRAFSNWDILNVNMVYTERFIWGRAYGIYRGFEKVSEKKSEFEVLDEIRVAVRKIHSDMCEGDIVAAAWRVKRLAVFLDRAGIGAPLEGMLKEESVS